MRELGGVPQGDRGAVMGRFFLLVAAVALVALLGGCAARTAPPRIVEVPVAQPCLPAERIPAAPVLDRTALDGNATHDLDLVAAHALALKDWGETLRAALLACAGG